MKERKDHVILEKSDLDEIQRDLYVRAVSFYLEHFGIDVRMVLTKTDDIILCGTRKQVARIVALFNGLKGGDAPWDLIEDDSDEETDGGSPDSFSEPDTTPRPYISPKRSANRQNVIDFVKSRNKRRTRQLTTD